MNCYLEIQMFIFSEKVKLPITKQHTGILLAYD